MGVVVLTQAGRLFSRQSPCSLHARPQAACPPRVPTRGSVQAGQRGLCRRRGEPRSFGTERCIGRGAGHAGQLPCVSLSWGTHRDSVSPGGKSCVVPGTKQ